MPAVPMRGGDFGPEINLITGEVVDAAIEVHRALGPGLPERLYQECLVLSLLARGLAVEVEKPVYVTYLGTTIDHPFRLDIVVNGCVVVELKAVETLIDVHFAQVLTYLKLARLPVGLLINFNSVPLAKGIRRLARRASSVPPIHGQGHGPSRKVDGTTGP